MAWARARSALRVVRRGGRRASTARRERGASRAPTSTRRGCRRERDQRREEERQRDPLEARRVGESPIDHPLLFHFAPGIGRARPRVRPAGEAMREDGEPLTREEANTAARGEDGEDAEALFDV